MFYDKINIHGERRERTFISNEQYPLEVVKFLKFIIWVEPVLPDWGFFLIQITTTIFEKKNVTL